MLTSGAAATDHGKSNSANYLCTALHWFIDTEAPVVGVHFSQEQKIFTAAASLHQFNWEKCWSIFIFVFSGLILTIINGNQIGHIEWYHFLKDDQVFDQSERPHLLWFVMLIIIHFASFIEEKRDEA